MLLKFFNTQCKALGVASLFGLLSVGNAQALTVSFDQDIYSPETDFFSVSMIMSDFSGIFLAGGGINHHYDDSYFSVLSIDVKAPTGLIISPPVDSTENDTVYSIDFADFIGLDGGTVESPNDYILATLTFTINPDTNFSGSSLLSLSESLTSPFAGNLGSDFGEPVNPNVIFESAAVTAVPVPAAGWLFASALAGIFSISRKQRG